MSFWCVVEGNGSNHLVTLVKAHWGGGRVLMLPNGLVVKPLQDDEEVGQRVVIGRFDGSIMLERSGAPPFDMSQPGVLRPGDAWPGPTTTGLECVLKEDGSLVCTWQHPTILGRDEVVQILRGPDRSLAKGFRTARIGDITGRIRITANGHIVTNRLEPYGNWVSVYVGLIDPKSWPIWNNWIAKERT